MSIKDLKSEFDSFFDEEMEKEVAKNSEESVSYEKDPDDWYPTVDKAGNGVAIIRFLPGKRDEKLNFVQWLSYSFKHLPTGRWYIENSLKKSKFDSTPDPVSIYNKRLYASSTDKDHPNRKQSSNQKLKYNFRANIYIVSDPLNPENNGTIKKFKFGKFFFNMIDTALNPADLGALTEPKMNPFNPFKGSNLKIIIKTEKKAGFPDQRNYEDSKWIDTGPFADDEIMEKVYKEIQENPKWSLKQYISDDKYKTFDALKKRLDFVIGIDTATGKPLEDAGKAADKPSEESGTLPPKEQKSKAAKSDKTDDDDYFNSLMDAD